MNNTLNYIRRIEEMRGKYLNKYFNAGQIDAIFSETSKVRKQTTDGKSFECKYYLDLYGDYVDFKISVRNCGAILKPTGTFCPITNKPMSAKVKQYYVCKIDFADGISKHIEKLKQVHTKIENNVKEQTIPTYEEFVGYRLVIAKMFDSNWNCLSIEELKKFLGKELADGKDITINNSTITQLFNSNQISLRLARYLYNYLKKNYSKEIVFNYVDMTESYNDRVQDIQGYIKNLQNRLVEIETEIKEWEEIKGLYS